MEDHAQRRGLLRRLEVHRLGRRVGGTHRQYQLTAIRVQLDLGRDVLVHQPAHPAARGAEAEHVALFQDPAGHEPAVDPGPVTR